jgi:opacity protein-like surface antigen
MKKITTIILSTSLLLSSSALAENHFINSEVLPYLRIDSGWAQFQRVNGLNTINGNSKLKSKTNNVVGAGIGVGINFGDKIRSDLTWSHHLQPELHSENNNTSVKRKPLIDAYFFNLYYETGIRFSIFNPYIGAGAGLATVKDKLSYLVINNNTVNSGSYPINRKNNFAYKFIIGSAFDLNERIKFDLSYNYHDYGKTKARIDLLGKQIGKTHYRAHIINAGLRFGL